MTDRTEFRVAYSYYRYNDGSANNGDIRREVVCKSPEQALSIAAMINRIALRNEKPLKEIEEAKENRSEEEADAERDLERDLIDGACGGYFYPGAAAFVYHIRREPLVAATQGA